MLVAIAIGFATHCAQANMQASSLTYLTVSHNSNGTH